MQAELHLLMTSWQLRANVSGRERTNSGHEREHKGVRTCQYRLLVAEIQPVSNTKKGSGCLCFYHVLHTSDSV
jgi:hypothetical protein